MKLRVDRFDLALLVVVLVLLIPLTAPLIELVIDAMRGSAFPP